MNVTLHWYKVALCLMLWAGTGCDMKCNDNVVSESQVAKCQTKMHLIFPKSTKYIAMTEETGGPDSYIRLKLEMERTQVLDFLESTPFKKMPLSTSRKPTGMLRSRESWWKPNEAKVFRAAETQPVGNEAIELLIDDGNMDHVIVYIYWFQLW